MLSGLSSEPVGARLVCCPRGRGSSCCCFPFVILNAFKSLVLVYSVSHYLTINIHLQMDGSEGDWMLNNECWDRNPRTPNAVVPTSEY